MNQFGQPAPGPAPASGPGAGGGAGGNNTAKIVGITCGVLLLLSCCCGGGFFAFTGAGVGAIFAGGPKASTDAWLDECQSGNFQNALRRMNGPYQSTHNVQSFQAAVQSLPALTTFTDRTMQSINVANNTGTVSGTLTAPTGQHSIQFTATQINDNWYIDSVAVDGIPLR